MTDTNESQPSELDKVISDYLVAVEAGEARDVETLCGKHPELATEIREFFKRSRKLVGSLGQDQAAETIHIGGYRIGQEIGRGGMGVVFEARQLNLDRPVAIKVLRGDGLTSDVARARFDEEARVVAKMKHDNIVDVLEFGRVDSTPYLVMPLLDGRSLSQVIREEPLREESAAKVMVRVADAIQHAHQQGVIHRDIKPGNIIGDETNCRVTDFGLAFREESDHRLTKTNDLPGTPGFLAPEIIRGQTRGSVQTDIYAMGATLYALLVGQAPHRAATFAESIMLALQSDPVSPQQFNSNLSTDINSITLKCLHSVPAQRYQSASDLKDDLQRLLEGKPVVARPVGRLETIRRWAARNKLLASALSLSVLLATGLIAGGVYSYVRVSNSLQQEQSANESANESLKTALSSIRQFYRDVSASGVFNDTPETVEFRKKLLNDGVEQIQALAAQNIDNEPVQYELAETFAVLGNIEDQLGHPKEALKARLEAARIFDELWSVDAEKSLIMSYTDCLQRLASSSSNGRDFDKADEYTTRAIEVSAPLERFAETDPRAALRAYQLEFGHYRSLEKRGEGAEILDDAAEVMQKFDALAEQNPDDASIWMLTSQTHMFYGIMQIRSNPVQTESTHLEHWRLGADFGRRCVELDPDNREYQRQVMMCTANELAAIAREETPDSEMLQRQVNDVVSYFRSAAEDNPANLKLQINLIQALADTAVMAEKMGAIVCRDYANETLAVCDALEKEQVTPAELGMWKDLQSVRRIALTVLADLATSEEDFAQAVKYLEQANQSFKEVRALVTTEPAMVADATTLKVKLTETYSEANRFEDARRVFLESVQSFRKTPPSTQRILEEFADLILHATDADVMQGAGDKYAAECETAFDIFKLVFDETKEPSKVLLEQHQLLDARRKVISR